MIDAIRHIKIEPGRMGMIWVAGEAGHNGLHSTYVPARRTAIYHVNDMLKTMDYMYDKLIY